MKVELFSAPSAFDALADTWDSLLDSRRSDNLYMTNRWLKTWWKHMHPGELAIVTVRDDQGAVQGIGPWFIENLLGERVVRLIGCLDIVDYLDVIVRPGFENPVYQALMDFMCSEDAPQWDRLQFCDIPADSPSLQLFPDLAVTHGLIYEASVQDVCPIIDLPGSFEEYLESLDKKQRHELRRKRRRADAEDTRFYIAGPEHDLHEEIQAFLSLMEMSTPEKADFLTVPGHRPFFEEMGPLMYETGHLDLAFLTINGQRAAAMWQFQYRDRVMLYNSGLNTADFLGLSPGIVLLTYSIENAIERGFRKYDFLRGDEEYKFRMGARPTTVNRIDIRRAGHVLPT